MKPKHIFIDDVVLTPQEQRRELQRERREAAKERDLYRKGKRRDKRSLAY